MSSLKVKMLYTVAFLDLFACSMAVPLLSPHLRSLGVSHFLIGLMSSLYAGLQLLSGPIIGSWSDIKGHYFVLQVTILTCSSLYFLLGATTAVTVIVLSRIGLGLLKHTQTLCRALLSDLVSSKDQLAVQSRLISFGAVGFIVGPAIGGHLVELNDGFHHVCLLVMLLFWINFVILYFGFSNNPSSQTQTQRTSDVNHENASNEDSFLQTRAFESGSPQGHADELKRNKKGIYSDIYKAFKNLSDINWTLYWDIFALKFLLGLALAIHFQNFSLFMRDVHNIQPKWIGYTISLQAIAGATMGFAVDWIGKFYKNDENNFLRTCHGFSSLTFSFILLSLAPNLMFVILSLLLVSASASLLRVTTSEVMLRKTEPNQRGSLIGSAQSMSSMARFIAPLCSGIIYDIFSFYGLITLTIAITGTATGLSLLLYRTEKQSKKLS